jgi:hypothetical protein
LENITFYALEILLMFFGCPKDKAQEAIKEADYRLIHNEDAEEELFKLICYWANYLEFYKNGEHSIAKPGEFIASRIKKIRIPPNQHHKTNPILEIVLKAILFALALREDQLLPRGSEREIPDGVKAIIQNHFPDLTTVN